MCTQVVQMPFIPMSDSKHLIKCVERMDEHKELIKVEIM